MILLPTAYLGNLQYYAKLLSGEACIDLHEHYLKQSYRNRCDILTANGITSLTVPVYHSGGEKVPSHAIRIDYSKRWQHQHWQAIVSAYRGSPYFAHYEEEFAPFYAERFDLLCRFNDALQQKVLHLLDPSGTAGGRIASAERYLPAQEATAAGHTDFRTVLSPKPRLRRPDPSFEPPDYYQVFSDRHPFAPNLSIIDLLFCEGPAAAELLRASHRPQ